jgi:hypothetical protein
MTGWLLTVILFATIGSADQAEFSGKHPYPSLNACIAAGRELGNWLTQDFIRIRLKCTNADGSQLTIEPRGIPAYLPSER